MIAVVTGDIATCPIGGVAWDYGQYVFALERLGFDVYYLEDSGVWMYDPDRDEVDSFTEDDATYGVKFLKQFLSSHSPTLADRWHVRSPVGATFGLEADEMAAIVADADVFLNVSGCALLRDEYMPCRCKVLIDTDPGFNHFLLFPRWDACVLPAGVNSYRAHDRFFTYAERLSQPDCRIPDLGLTWNPTRPPVVRGLWQREEGGGMWTTVMNWNTYDEPIRDGDASYGSKDLEFAAVEPLPTAVPASLQLAVSNMPPRDRDRLRALGWSIVDGTAVSRTADDYRTYVQRSRGEFSVAKNVYVATRSGWFSCRSVCYLASARPVVVEDTGFSELLPTGEGLLAFSDFEGARRGVIQVEKHYDEHAEAALSIAHSQFDSEQVVGDLLTRLSIGGL